MRTRKIKSQFPYIAVLIALTTTLVACGDDVSTIGSSTVASASSTSSTASGTTTGGTTSTSTGATASSSSTSSSSSTGSSTASSPAGGGTSSSTATTGSAALSWTAPVTNVNGTVITGLAGYHIYYGTTESALNNTIDVSSPTETTYTVSGLAKGTYYFSVVAYNSLGVDSSDSNVATKTIT